MELERYDEKNFDPKSETIPRDTKKENASSRLTEQAREDGNLTPTPAKITEPPRTKNKQTVLLSTSNVEEIQVPDEYKPLADLYDGIETSIRLLNMKKKKSPTFKNICAMVKVLTQRVLLSSHLAQIKHMLPEVINIEKILTHDERTLCMMPDMKVTLLVDNIQALPGHSAFMTARQIFRQKLLDFSTSHSESREIPEAMLPEPFCISNHIVLPNLSSVDLLIEAHTECEPSLAASSFGQTMKKHFSQKIIVPETEKTELLASLVPSVNDYDETDLIMKISPRKECSLASDSALTASSAALIFSPRCSNYSGLLHPVTLQTPVQPTPAKRPLGLSTCKKSNDETKISSHTAAKRSLTFDGKEYENDSLHPEATKSIATDDYITASPFTQVVDKYKNQTMNQTGPGKRQEMLASLTDLINMIQRIFKSANTSLITKQELLQKIIAQNLDIVEIREVEEQLELLEELIPDWIFQKLVPTGDLCYSIRRVSDMESIRTRLSEAM